MKQTHAELEEKLACAEDGFWKLEEECEALAERLNERDKRIAELEAANTAMRGTITSQTNIIDRAITSETHLRERADRAEAALAERERVLREAASTIFTMECAYIGIFDEDEAVPVILADLHARAEEGIET